MVTTNGQTSGYFRTCVSEHTREALRMDHTEITATVVEEIDRLLAQQTAHPVISDRLKVSEYLVGVIAGDKLGWGRRPTPGSAGQRTFNCLRGIDAATIRMIQRMLQVNMLPQRQIAVETGVSTRIVEMVAAGKRLPISTERPFVFKDLGERFVEEPFRCTHCGAMLSIVPCRACRALRS